MACHSFLVQFDKKTSMLGCIKHLQKLVIWQISELNPAHSCSHTALILQEQSPLLGSLETKLLNVSKLLDVKGTYRAIVGRVGEILVVPLQDWYHWAMTKNRSGCGTPTLLQ